jgi:hypothetical protein
MVKGPMNDLERAQYDILAAARNRAKAAIDAYEAENGVSMAVEQQAEYYKNAATGAGRLLTINEKVYNQSRTFQSGWNKAFKQYVDDATNAAKQAERLFTKAFQGIEDVLVDFVKTGKFEWKNFVADMAEELLRSQIRQLLGGLGSALGLGNLGGGGALGDSPTNPLYVMDISGGGGSPFPNFGAGLGGIEGMFGGLGGGNFGGNVGGQKVGGGIFDSISNVFSGVTNTVSKIGSTIGGIYDFGKSVFSGVGDLFGGFFATGGMIPPGRFGVVGERGPEFVSGPASVTPMAATNVTYNINAVDAASFKAMIARDPAFIHAVAMQGSKSVPGRF